MTTRIYSKMMVLLATFCLATVALAEIPDPPDPVESDIAAAQARSQWVRRVQEASDLLGNQKPVEALAAFESLQKDLPTLDDDGLVALAIGDCQFQLKQYDQARTTYRQAAQVHPDLKETAWLRLVETELTMGKLDDATARIQEVQAGDASFEQKAWAMMRLGNIQEMRAIQLLEKAEQTYREGSNTFGKVAEPRISGRHWAQVHADDIKDTTTQLQAAMRQLMDRNEMIPIYWPGPAQAAALPSADVGKVKITGQITKAESEKDAKPRLTKNKDTKEAVELSVEKDGKVEVTVAGKKVDLDAAAQRQILKHLQYSLRIAGQRSDPDLESKRIVEEAKQVLERSKDQP